MNNKKIFTICILIIIIFVSFFSGLIILGVNNQEGIAAENDEEYKVDVIRLEGGDYGYPSPYAHYPRGPGGYKRNLIFDSLLERGEDGLIPWLAEDYEIRNDGKEYLFTIRDNIKWHDGESMTVEDIKFSFEYGLEHPLVWSDLKKEDIKNVEIVNENQILITVGEVNASLLYSIGKQRIIPKHIWKDVEFPKEYTKEDAVVGTGPYKLTDYSKEHGSYSFKAFDGFWGPKQKVKEIRFVPVSESTAAFERDKIDLTNVSPDLLARYKNDSEFKVIQSPAFWGYRLIFNMKEVSALKNKEVRKAFSYAIDSKELITKVERGAGEPGSAGILPPDHVYYNPDVKEYNRNPEKARKLLEEAGYESLSLNLNVADRTVRMAELLKEQLSEVGIEINVKSADGKTNDSRIDKNNYELAITGHGGWGGEPDFLIERFGGKNLEGGISSSGATGYSNSKLAELLSEQKEKFSNDKRKELLFKAQNILAEDVPEIPLYYTADYTVYRPEKYDSWMFMFDHHSLTHSKLSYLERE
ncbi:MAG: ABC transporter substrate-binding protein [bacterium]